LSEHHAGPTCYESQTDRSETERILLARLATFDEDVKTAVDARAAIAEIRKNLKQPAPR
jgi:hypothetical protein